MKTMTKYSIALVKEESKRYDFDNTSVSNPNGINEIAITALHMDTLAEEQFWIICLDTKNHVVGLHLVSQGSLNSSIVHPREVFKRALANNAATIIALHNHPSGDPKPSTQDLDITKRLVESGELIGIPVIDHLIVGDKIYISLKEKGLL